MLVQGNFYPARTYSDSMGSWALDSNTTAQKIVQFFDGDLRIGSEFLLTTNSTRALEFNPPITFHGGTIGVSAYQTTSGSDFGVTIDGTEYLFDVPTGSTASLHTFNIPAGNIEAMGMSASNIGWCAVQLNGITLTNDIDQGDPVKVTATDVSAKTITVDGGEWDVSNQSRVWSATGWTNPSSSENYAGSNAFDGNLETRAGGDTTDYTVYTFDPPLAFTDKVRIYGDLDTRGSTNPDIKANNTSVTGVANNVGLKDANQKWYEVLTDGGTLTSVSVKSVSGTYWGFINAIEVDGRLLVDAVNDSQVWSEGQQTNPDTNRSLTNLFNNDRSTIVAAPASPENATNLISLENTIDVNTTVFLYTTTANYNSGPYVLLLNGIEQGRFTPSGKIPSGYNEVLGMTGKSFNQISLSRSGSTGSGLAEIRVDGKLLIDPGTRDLGDTKVSTVTPKQGSGTVSDITGSVVTVSPYTDNCFKEGQYLTVNKTVNVTPNTDPIASYTSGTKTLVFDGPTNLGQFANGDEVYMTDADGNPATLNAETDTIESVVPIDTSTYLYKAHTEQVALNTLTWDNANQGPEEATAGSQPTTEFAVSFWTFIKFTGPTKLNYGVPNSGSLKTVSYFYSDDGVTWTFDSYYNQSGGNPSGPFADSINSAVYWAIAYQSGADNPVNLNAAPSASLTPDSWYQYTIPAPNISLNFPGDVSTNPDLRYFSAGDVVQSSNWIQGQQWSATNDGNAKSGEGWDRSFNGKTSGGATVANIGGTTVLTLPVDVTFTKLEVFGNNRDQAGSTRLYYTDTDYVSTWGLIPSGGSANLGWGDVTSAFDGVTKVLKKIAVINNGDNDPSRTCAIRVRRKASS